MKFRFQLAVRVAHHVCTRTSRQLYPKAALERAMKVQELILRAMAGRINCWQAAEILSISDRQMRRQRAR